jgi:hypothetical protein
LRGANAATNIATKKPKPMHNQLVLYIYPFRVLPVKSI